jgi:nitroreductase/dihydropteridine reductase
MNSTEKLSWRYATKKFDSTKKLTDSQVETLKNAFNLTATSYGLQPLKMLVISNEKIKENLQKHAFNQSQISDCSHLLVICIKSDIDSTYVDSRFDLEKEIRGTSEATVSGFRKFLKADIDKKSPLEIELFSKNQAYIALGKLMTVCAFEDIDSCPMEGFIPQKFDKLLNLKELDLKSVLLLPVGFRASDDYMSSLKKVRSSLNESIITID